MACDQEERDSQVFTKWPHSIIYLINFWSAKNFFWSARYYKVPRSLGKYDNGQDIDQAFKILLYGRLDRYRNNSRD